MNVFVSDLISRYPQLMPIKSSMILAFNALIELFKADRTLFVCGNGGSGADAEHIVGELLKGFLLCRSVSNDTLMHYKELYGDAGVIVANKLQGALRTISLLSHPGLTTAFANDVDPNMSYAQQLYALGRSGDMVLGISTSGNAENIYNTFMVAKAQGIKTILLTGNRKGKCMELANFAIEVPESETYKIQELHLPVYHTMCMVLEDYFFGGKGE